MEITVRAATTNDIPLLIDLYKTALDEQIALREAWSVAEGLSEPIDRAMSDLLDDPDSYFAVGQIDGSVFGFIWARIEPLLPQAGGEKIGVVRLVFVDSEARAVGIGEAMLDGALQAMRGSGVCRFDAIVSPGHRLAKNFFESAGFSARRITMYHRDHGKE